MMKVLVVSDAWHPQVNGVVRVFERLIKETAKLGVLVDVMGPGEWTTFPMPTYPEIRLAICTASGVARRIETFRPDFIHIATEGPLGFRAFQYCRKNGIAYTTSYHTRFPEYLRARLPVPTDWTYAWLRRIHNGGRGLMVTNESLKQELQEKSFHNINIWSRGVDCEAFRPMPGEVPAELKGLNGPIFLYVGRVSIEKNLSTFLSLDLPGTKVITGVGPELESLKSRFPDVVFTGLKTGDDLARIYSAADVFVFPSKTDTFGMVLLEAMACGVPVAAFPVTGPRDVIGQSGCGVLSEDLRSAALEALSISRDRCREHALKQSWSKSTRDFLDNIRIAHGLDRFSTMTNIEDAA